MNTQSTESLEKIRQQFESSPYPRVPLDKSPKDTKDFSQLYFHNLTTPYYLRNRQLIGTEDKVILDAGCGSGYKSLILAVANPGARIVGIDLSEQSVKLSHERLKHHGFEERAEFHTLLIEDLPQLGLEFDYINCDEVLYLLPDPIAGLKSFKSVLKPEGIIRANLHNSLQRQTYFQAQEAFKVMGLTEDNPGDLEVGLVVETMKALRDGTELKAKGWRPAYESKENEETVLMNHLLQGDKGYSIPDMFSALRASELEFIDMVNWRHWELTDLFKEPDNLPMFLALSLPGASVEERLHLFNLLHPVHRLIDFWCGHPNREAVSKPIDDWEQSNWQNAQVHLHPNLRHPQVKEKLFECLEKQEPFEISQYIPIAALNPVVLESNIAACCLLPLWDNPQPATAMVDRWLKVQPYDPVTMEAKSESDAFSQVQKLLSKLEVFLYVLIEQIS
ncbi:class I SAM-dependent methyltransferase [Leptolyngbya sp. FACHB-541]|uniref:class I SAM-dependent methyltransferase n=1 Tax=Leptolyngbya sp. FACHB-541 TaxID=2692810 RepID=UPI001687AF3A|nr:class I SAM-dependent methyltransferase [Leptolyngbya sp. FACHB-541]MBD1996780.1 class I SAM-dependent methyltransferase [Leptolyngbya sp. FACHB-541]